MEAQMDGHGAMVAMVAMGWWFLHGTWKAKTSTVSDNGIGPNLRASCPKEQIPTFWKS